MIIFEKIRYKNFVSTGNHFTEIILNDSPSTLIIGKNGAGKSTILDALCFVLFGKPFRKINKPQLVNTINQKDCLVEIEFSLGSKKYKVVRGMKPTIFEIYCDGILVNQDAKAKDYQEHLEKLILKLNYKSFTQIVILGSSSFVPFMQLSAADRRAIIEDLLDIQIFSSMNNLVKNKLSEIKDAFHKVKYNIDLTGEKIVIQKQNIEENKKKRDEEILKKKKEISDSENLISNTQKNIELIQKHIQILTQKISDKTLTESKNKKLLLLEAKIESNIGKIEKDIKFYEENEDCPTCRQSIATDFRNEQISERKDKITVQRKGLEEISEEIAKVNSRLDNILQITNHIAEHNNQLILCNSQIENAREYIKKQTKEIEGLSFHKDTSEDGNERLKELKKELSGQLKEAEELSIEKQYYDLASTLLKDTGIKTKIIKQYLPVMNKLINKYLAAMDFFVNFNIDENFEETIKSRHRDEFSYDSFSEGEKMRIDLSLLFSWRQIAKMKNSTNTNLLILDEVFDSSLDTVGTDEFLKLIYEIGNDTNVFIISHKGDILYDKFKTVIRFEKKNNFSQMIK